jgi:hypothetical protein
MAVKSLVLDIDGVIVRDKLLLAHVSDNCVKYVQSKLPECKDPRNVNRILYLTHGHTARGLKHSFGVDTSDFNEKVYDDRLMDHLAEILYGTKFQQEAKEIHDFTKKGWNVTLFTNAPSKWGTMVARAISDEVYLRCPGENVMDSPLKPEAVAYQNFSKAQTHVFVDDFSPARAHGLADQFVHAVWSARAFRVGDVVHGGDDVLDDHLAVQRDADLQAVDWFIGRKGALVGHPEAKGFHVGQFGFDVPQAVFAVIAAVNDGSRM